MINCTHSNYCYKFYKYSKGLLLEKLLEFSKQDKYKNWLVMPTDDSHIEILSKNINVLSKYFKLSVNHWEIMKLFYNKKYTYKMCDKLDIEIPKTYFPSSLADIKNLDLNYPVIIKPAVMHKFFSSTIKKVFKCNNRKSIIENYIKASKIIPHDEIIIQESIRQIKTKNDLFKLNPIKKLDQNLPKWIHMGPYRAICPPSPSA